MTLYPFDDDEPRSHRAGGHGGHGHEQSVDRGSSSYLYLEFLMKIPRENVGAFAREGRQMDDGRWEGRGEPLKNPTMAGRQKMGP